MRKLCIGPTGTAVLLPTSLQSCGADEVVIAVEACGVCGSDLVTWRARRPGTDSWGHEVLGKVVATGVATDAAWLGKRVVTRTSVPCGTCRYCREGRMARCNKWRRQAYNGFASYVTLPAHLIEMVPAGAGGAAVLIEPLYVAMDLAAKAEVAPGDSVLLVGCGPIGLLVLHLLQQRPRVSVTVMYQPESEARRRIGEDWGARMLSTDVVDTLPLDATFDCIIVTAPYRVIPSLVRYAARGARIVYNGLSDEPLVTLDLRHLHTSGIALVPSFPHPQLSFRSAGEYAARHSAQLVRLISHKVHLSASTTVFDLFTEQRDRAVKVVVDCEN